MSERRIDWDYVNEAAAEAVREEFLYTPTHPLPRFEFIVPLNRRRLYLQPGDSLIGGSEGLIESRHGYNILLDVEIATLVFVAGDYRASEIRRYVRRLNETAFGGQATGGADYDTSVLPSMNPRFGG